MFAFAVIAALVAALAPPLSASATVVPDACPDITILDQAEVEALPVGTPLIGLTVESGPVPSEIDFVVEHVQRGALQDGAPLVVARAISGTPVTDGKGIWFGMSGSPVYTVDGGGDPDALVGAVAFGLSWEGDSTIAGLQPAYQMEKVRGYASSGSASSTASISPSGAAKVAASSGLPTYATGDFKRLAVPLAMSRMGGAAGARRLDVLRRAAENAGMDFFPVGGLASASTAAAAAAPATLSPGDNFAAALSYGYLSAAGIGTTTYVCDDKAMAFGHPFFFNGKQVLGANAADSAYVVKDSLGGSYKMASIGDWAGLVDQDRAAGIRTSLGTEVPVLPINTTVNAPDIGQSGDAHSDIVQSSEVVGLAWTHALTHLDDTADLISDGSSRLTWTINGVTAGGLPWQLQRGNRYISPYDITFESSWDLFNDLYELQNNPFTRVTFTGIHLDATVREDVYQYEVKRVRLWQDGAYRRVDSRLAVQPGQVLKLEVTEATGAGNKVVYREITVPQEAMGRGTLRVGGRSGGGGGGEEFFVDCAYDDCGSGGGGGPSTFQELLVKMAKSPRNDVLRTRLTFFSFDEKTGQGRVVTARDRVSQNRVVTGSVSIPVKVPRG
jgi:hypothetical protein